MDDFFTDTTETIAQPVSSETAPLNDLETKAISEYKPFGGELNLAVRRQAVARALLHVPPSEYETEYAKLAERFQVTKDVIKRDIQNLKRFYRQQSLQPVDDLIAAEYAYLLELREEAWQEYDSQPRGKRRSNMLQLILSISARIHTLKGLDAPLKTQDWTGKTWQDYAKETGVPQDEMVKALVAEVLRMVKDRPELASEMLEELQASNEVVDVSPEA